MLEVAYVGTQSHLSWRTVNLNEVNIFENGFLNEFKTAQNNLGVCRANAAACRAAQARRGSIKLTRRQTTLPTGGIQARVVTCQSLEQPWHEARGGLAPGGQTQMDSDPPVSSPTWKTARPRHSPDSGQRPGFPFAACSAILSPCARSSFQHNAPGPFPINLSSCSTRSCLAALGTVDRHRWSNAYNGLQVQFRQPSFSGLSWNTNYTWSKSTFDLDRDTAIQDLDFLTLRDIGLNKRVSPFDIRHVIQTYAHL